MKKTIQLLNEMQLDGVIEAYAIFGAVAQMRYTEAVMTMDIDVLVSVPDMNSLAILSPIYTYCAGKGYSPCGEAILIGDWPVQFIPVFDDLSIAALENAIDDDFDGIPVKVTSPIYLALMALKLGRTKDKLRIDALLNANVIDESDLECMASEYNLNEQWIVFKERFINEN